MSKMTADEISLFLKENYPISVEEREELNKIRNKLTYYKIHDLDMIGKKEQGIPYLYQNDQWVIDDDNIISDRLIGYDGESIGSSTIFNIDEISEEEALKLINK